MEAKAEIITADDFFSLFPQDLKKNKILIKSQGIRGYLEKIQMKNGELSLSTITTICTMVWFKFLILTSCFFKIQAGQNCRLIAVNKDGESAIIFL